MKKAPPPQLATVYAHRSFFKGLVANILKLNRCGMRGNKKRWLFADMGFAVHVSQLDVYTNNRSIWRIKQVIFGI